MVFCRSQYRQIFTGTRELHCKKLLCWLKNGDLKPGICQILCISWTIRKKEGINSFLTLHLKMCSFENASGHTPVGPVNSRQEKTNQPHNSWSIIKLGKEAWSEAMCKARREERSGTYQPCQRASSENKAPVLWALGCSRSWVQRERGRLGPMLPMKRTCLWEWSKELLSF